MLLISTIRNNPEEVISRLEIKNFDGKATIDQIIEVDSARRKTQTELDQLLAHQNSLARQIGDLFKSGKQAEANDLKNKSSALKDESKQLQKDLHASAGV